jgi:hypothetical protein
MQQIFHPALSARTVSGYLRMEEITAGSVSSQKPIGTLPFVNGTRGFEAQQKGQYVSKLIGCFSCGPEASLALAPCWRGVWRQVG